MCLSFEFLIYVGVILSVCMGLFCEFACDCVNMCPRKCFCGRIFVRACMRVLGARTRASRMFVCVRAVRVRVISFCDSGTSGGAVNPCIF